MKQAVRSLLSRYTPQLFENLRAINHRRFFGKRYQKFQDEVAARLYPDGDIRVLTGPFAGMRYFNEIVWGTTTQKWLGSYEIELESILQEIAEAPYEVVLDVGCAEGYFACGFAFRMPRAQVFAFDTDFLSRKQTQKLAKLNGVEDRLTVAGLCMPVDFARLQGDRSLLFCDIEGAERALLDPEACPALRDYDILVELHETEGLEPLEALFGGRFGPTHRIETVHSTSRKSWIETHEAEFASLDRASLEHATDEHRPRGQTWLWMKRTTAAAPHGI